MVGMKLAAGGYRLFSTTSHPRLGKTRNNSPYWTATKKKMTYSAGNAFGKSTKDRFVYSHEFQADGEAPPRA